MDRVPATDGGVNLNSATCETVLPVFPGDVGDGRRMTIRNTFIDVDDAMMSPPAAGRLRAQTSPGEIEVDEVMWHGQKDEHDLFAKPYKLPATPMKVCCGERQHEASAVSSLTLGVGDDIRMTVRSTFIDVDEPNISPPVGRLRAQTSPSVIDMDGGVWGAQGEESAVSFQPLRWPSSPVKVRHERNHVDESEVPPPSSEMRGTYKMPKVSNLPIGIGKGLRMSTRNTPLNVENGLVSPPARRSLAQTSPDGIEANAILPDVQGEQHVSSTRCRRVSSPMDVCFEDCSDHLSPIEVRDKRRTLTVCVRNTFIDIDSEEMTLPVQRCDKRAHTWHGRPFSCLNSRPVTLDDEDPDYQVDDCAPGCDEDQASEFDADDIVFGHVKTDLSELEFGSRLSNRVRAPPPLCRVSSPLNGSEVSPLNTISTSASSHNGSWQMDRFGPTSMPSVSSVASTTLAVGCGTSAAFTEHPGTTCTPSLSSPSPDASAALQTTSSGVEQFCTVVSQPHGQPGLSDMFANMGEATNELHPLYSFRCFPSTQTFPNSESPGTMHSHLRESASNERSSGSPDITNAYNLEIDCSLLPSIGSAGHHGGLCKPCAFGIERCKNGANCEFCHICKPIGKSKRGRWVLKRRKHAAELQNDILNLQTKIRAAAPLGNCASVA